MISKVSLFIARRYFLSRYSSSTVNLISILSLLGIGFISMTIVIVMSVFNGLEKLQMERVDQFFSDWRVSPQTGKWMKVNADQIDQIANYTDFQNHSLAIEHKAFLGYKDFQQLIFLKGIDTNFVEQNRIDSNLVWGETFFQKKATKGLILGQSISLEFGIPLMDYRNPIKIFAPQTGTQISLNPQKMMVSQRGYATGLMDINSEINQQYVLSSLPFARKIFQLEPNQYSYIDIQLKNKKLTKEELTQWFEQTLGIPVSLSSFEDHNSLIIKVIKTERIMTFLICVLILFIATFNLIGSLTMLIIDKKNNLVTLSQIGLDFKKIQQIFIWESVIIGVLGMLFGTLLAWMLVVLQQKFAFIKLGASGLAYPVEMSYTSIVINALVVVVLSLLSGLLTIRSMKKHLSGYKS